MQHCPHTILSYFVMRMCFQFPLLKCHEGDTDSSVRSQTAQNIRFHNKLRESMGPWVQSVLPKQHVTHIDTYVDVNTNTTQNECTTTHIHATTNMHTTNTHKQACKSTRSHICFNKCTKEHTNKQTNKPHQKRSKQTDKQTNKQTNDKNKRNQ